MSTSAQQINTILLVGGTHGNELTGVRIVEQWSTVQQQLPTTNIDINTLLANPLAVEKRVRFVDDDLNRQFTACNSSPASPSSNEVQLATNYNDMFGVNSAQQPDLVIDIHNTTSNMGATLICVSDDPFNQALARFVKDQLPAVNVLLENEKSYAAHPYLCTLGKAGIMLEMGAQPQGVCRADLMLHSLELLASIISFCEQWNSQTLPSSAACEVFQFIENIEFPRDPEGKVNAMIHPQLQDADFLPLHPGHAMFTGFDGKVANWQGEETVYPHFINEAAYQRLHVAFATARKIFW
ncbi:aspartoacylase [Alteromonas flava]|uniref:aspartoacylase n=1 Tax=Alteromonas flava TaxID=2048003 RepID=UPI000C285D4C|nr:aspartoacylase [Alteromonas flava]